MGGRGSCKEMGGYRVWILRGEERGRRRILSQVFTHSKSARLFSREV
jgi:hypothetical protein